MEGQPHCNASLALNRQVAAHSAFRGPEAGPAPGMFSIPRDNLISAHEVQKKLSLPGELALLRRLTL